MAKLFIVDFKNKKLVTKRDLENLDGPNPDQVDMDKYNFFLELIDNGVVAVNVNTKHSDIDLPEVLKGDVVAKINWSKKFQIKDFVYDDQGVQGSLSYSGKPYLTKVPWRAVWAMTSADGSKKKEWMEDYPIPVETKSE